MKLSTEQYQCAECGGVFKKGWTDEEAHAQNFGVPTDEDTAVLCDECYKRFTKWFKAKAARN